MARILYGVQGDANGHLSRSLTVAELLRGHEILFVGGGVVSRVRQHGYAYEALPMLGTELRDNGVDVLATIIGCSRTLAEQCRWIRRLAEIITAFDPALIITDYEYFTPRAARKTGRPCISLDHQHVLTRTRNAAPPGQLLNRMLTEMCIHFVSDSATRFFMSSFYHPLLRDPKNDELFGTLPRTDVLALTPTHGEHAVLYMRGGDPQKIKHLLGARKREYRVYGFGKQPDHGAIRFKDFSREGFLEDLASASYVISNGGHGLLSESLHLNKPSLCVPTHLHYEQYWNSYHVQKNGYGRFQPNFDMPCAVLDDFETHLDAFRARIAAGVFSGREALQRRLQAVLNSA